MTPLRIQRRRAKGWRLPDNTICVSRPSVWGNPFVIGQDGTGAKCVRLYGTLMGQGLACISGVASYKDQKEALAWVRGAVHQLRGINLACWCRLCPEHKAGKPFGVRCEACAPCHADVLGVLANRPALPAA